MVLQHQPSDFYTAIYTCNSSLGRRQQCFSAAFFTGQTDFSMCFNSKETNINHLKLLIHTHLDPCHYNCYSARLLHSCCIFVYREAKSPLTQVCSCMAKNSCIMGLYNKTEIPYCASYHNSLTLQSSQCFIYFNYNVRIQFYWIL